MPQPMLHLISRYHISTRTPATADCSTSHIMRQTNQAPTSFQEQLCSTDKLNL